jgi:tRNA-2-methylthio-N6-dimethylallyladenosine synthase
MALLLESSVARAVYNRGAAMEKRVYLQTYGCQMNERDSEEILGMLAAQGYAPVVREDEADVILLNTCSVRAHAEERAFGKMAILQRLKQARPDVVLGILGCMAKAQREEVFRRLPQVDLVAGPAEIYDLPDLLAKVAEVRQGAIGPSGARLLAIDRKVRPLERKPAGDWRRGGVAAFVTIMEGCDKKCAYCIVPTTRGQEVSRPVEEVLDEVQQLARAGYRQVTLLGQNVNSYGKRFPDGSGFRGPAVRRRWLAAADERLVDFPALLRQIDAKTAIARVRFTTSHPFDAHDELFRAMAECPSVCEYLHLPVQSGSDRILHAMRRGYTAETYRATVARLRELVPDVALSTDVIVGFPGESEEDFEATVALMAAVEYDSAFLFKYSPRPGTEAAGRADDVPRATKERRHQALLALQGDVSRRKLERWIGRQVEVLVTERNRRGQLAGHTRHNVNAVCDGPDSCLGELVGVEVERATPTTLVGRLVA